MQQQQQVNTQQVNNHQLQQVNMPIAYLNVFVILRIHYIWFLILMKEHDFSKYIYISQNIKYQSLCVWGKKNFSFFLNKIKVLNFYPYALS